jgi:hypothetical protein
VSIDDGETWEAVHAVEDSLYTSGGRVTGRSVSVGGRNWGLFTPPATQSVLAPLVLMYTCPMNSPSPTRVCLMRCLCVCVCVMCLCRAGKDSGYGQERGGRRE